MTALRGIFALWVLGYHLRSLHPVPVPDPFGVLLHGYLGVDFFMMLSGFVLAGAYGSGAYSAVNICRFVVMRIGRMYPLHILVLGICVIVAWVLGSPYSWHRVLVEGFLVQNWPGVHVSPRSINGPSWSIGVELLANLILALIGWFPLRINRFSAIITAIAGYAVLSAIALNHNGILDLSMPNSPIPFFECLTEFVIGVLLFRWKDLGQYLSDWPLTILIVITVIVILLGISDAMIVPLIAALILGVSANKKRVSKILEFAPIYGIGKISFSVYLVHLPILYSVRFFVIRSGLNDAWSAAYFILGTLFLTLSVSILSFRYIEEPYRIKSKRWAATIGSASTVIRG